MIRELLLFVVPASFGVGVVGVVAVVFVVFVVVVAVESCWKLWEFRNSWNFTNGFQNKLHKGFDTSYIPYSTQ